MTLLGIDTSTSAAGACVLRSDGEAFEEAPPAERLGRPPAHGSELMPAVVAAMERARVSWGELDAIAVGVGPGAFTGLRIGVSTARALARANAIPLRRVSSLAALAAGIPAPLRLPLIDARRGELFAALYDGDDERWPPFAAAPGDLVARLRAAGLVPPAGAGTAGALFPPPAAGDGAHHPPLAAGDGSVRFRGLLEQAGIPVAPDGSPAHMVRALQVCRLGAAAVDEPPEAVLPEYLREPDARPQQ